MAWIYLVESAECQKPYVPGSPQSPTVSESPTLKPHFWIEWQTVRFQLHRYGMTSRPLLENICHRSIFATEVFPAKICRLLDVVKAWEESAQGYFSRSVDLQTKPKRHSSSSKTYLPFALADYIPSSKSFPAVGMCVGGLVYPLKKLERTIKENDGSCLLPTPTASNYGSNKGGALGRNGKNRPSLQTMAAKNLWPTPRASANENRQTKPTPSQLAGKHGMNLATAVQMWPTPKAMDGDRACVWTQTRYNLATGRTNLKSAVGSAHLDSGGAPTGQLNPTWVEWLMGFPLGWTALDAWATQWFRHKREQLLKNSRASKTK